MKRLFIAIVIGAFLCMGSTECEEKKSTADQRQTEKTKQAMTEAERQIGYPNIINFQQRKLMKMI